MNKTNVKSLLNGIRKRYANGEKVSDDDFMILMKHFPFHPEWSTEKCPPPRRVESIVVARRNPFEHHSCFHVVLDDGTTHDLSVQRVVDGEFGRKTRSASYELSDIIVSCRSAIKPIIFQIRRKVMELVKENGGAIQLVSRLTGKEFIVRSPDDFHIDHYDKTFSEVFNEWINVHPEIASSPGEFVIDSTHDEDTYGVKFKDPLLAQEFVEFHKTHTHLRLLPPHENLSEAKTFAKIMN